MRRLLPWLFVFSCPLLGQGIKSTVGNLVLDGSWEERPQWVGQPAAEKESIFYSPESGALVRLGEGKVWDNERATQILAILQDVIPGNSPLNPSDAPHPQFQRNLASVFFPLPDDYMKQNGDRITSGRKPLKVWELKNIRGNVPAFYASQLSSGLLTKMSGGNLTVYTDWSPAKLIRAERRRVGAAEAILAELETEHPVDKKITEVFGMPPSVAGQRIIYTYVCYAPAGFNGSGTGEIVLSAAPTNSVLNADKILALLKPKA